MNEKVEDGDYVMLMRCGYNDHTHWPKFSPGDICQVESDGELYWIYKIVNNKNYGEDLGYWSYKKMSGNLWKLL